MTNLTTPSAHTPAPWFLEPVDLIVYDGDEKDAEAIAFAEDRHSAEEREANARLITAAPDLLQACKDSLDFLSSICADNESDHGEQAMVRLIEKAIAKAEDQ